MLVHYENDHSRQSRKGGNRRNVQELFAHCGKCVLRRLSQIISLYCIHMRIEDVRNVIKFILRAQNTLYLRKCDGGFLSRFLNHPTILTYVTREACERTPFCLSD
jgi:hypothetical protein